MGDDVILNKAASIERCLHRIEEKYAGNEQNLIGNQTKQDAIVLNLQRARETAIDLAMYHVCSESAETWCTSGQPGCLFTVTNRRSSSS